MNAKRFFVIPFLLLFLHFSVLANVVCKPANDKEFVVVLDAGHGGHDPGNLGNGYLEKNIALNIVLKVGSILERNPNIKVIYTRKDDTFVDLYVRGEIANKANADLFVSVHCDSHSSDAHGAGTFVLGLHANKQNFEIAKKENSVIYLEDNYESRYADYDINSPESVIGLTIMQEEFLDQSILLAKTIQDQFSNKLRRKDREVKQAGFIVLHQTFMPSVLIETGFLTNDDEGAYLNSKQGQAEMGTAIANAILGYRNGTQANAAQLGEQVNTPVPDPDKEVIDRKPETVVVDAAEEFAKNPGESPLAEKPVAEPVEKGQEKVVETANEAENVKNDLKQESEISESKVAAAIEKHNEAQVVKVAISEPEKNVVEKKAINIPPAEVKKPATNTVNIVFKVQLMASSKTIPLNPIEFNGLNKLSKEPVKNLFRYMYGSTNSYKEAKLLKINADKKGYPSSYIVAYKDGVRIPTPEAIKMVSE